jgi:hypothetical protein
MIKIEVELDQSAINVLREIHKRSKNLNTLMEIKLREIGTLLYVVSQLVESVEDQKGNSNEAK